MQSNRCHITKHGQGRMEALHETEKAAAYGGLSKKDSLRLRLLAEELMGILQAVVGDYSADFWVEEEGGTFQLILRADAKIDPDAKDRLVAIASSGKNEAAKGVKGKLASLFETYVLGGPDGVAQMPSTCFMMGMGELHMSEWSMLEYRQQLATNKATHAQEWDELERSIVASLADDITVGARAGWAEIRVSKRF